MKIEKISDTQIRCTLNYSDLHSRSLSLKELAYGSSAARELFHEMILRAGEEVGFHTEDMPLMVEAIPLSNDGIILNITKIQDPEELDTRFARFAPSIENMDPEEAGTPKSEVNADLLESLRNILSIGDPPAEKAPGEPSAASAEEEAPAAPVPGDRCLAAIYRFGDLDTLLHTAKVLRGIYHGGNALYKNEHENCYYLALHRGSHTPEEYNKVCNILTEYGQKIRSTPASESYYKEHYTTLIPALALQKLAR